MVNGLRIARLGNFAVLINEPAVAQQKLGATRVSMHNNSAMALVGLVLGGVFLLLAFVSTVSKVTLSVFNPWLGRQIRHRDHPRTFISVVFGCWLMGAAAVVLALMSMLSSR